MSHEDNDAETHARGMTVRREVLGDDHVDRAVAGTTPFTEDFQDLITRYAWGEIWSRPGLDRRTRSFITLTALVALGREDELEMHVRAALGNGLTPDEISELLLHCAVYCGVPAANGAFAVAQRVIDGEEGAMTRAVILSAVRTPVGRYGGGLAGVRPDDLAAVAVAAAVERAGVDPAEIDDVWLGCANQAGEDNRNVARMARCSPGCRGVPGATVNRLCASGLRPSSAPATPSMAGDGDLFVAGGVESMSRAPLVMAKPERAVRARRPHAPRHDARLAVREPALRGALLAAIDGRDGRARRRAVRHHARGSGRVRARSRSGAGRPPTRPARSPTSSVAGGRARARRAPAARTRRPRSWRRSSPRSARAGRSRRATPRASTTAPPRS